VLLLCYNGVQNQPEANEDSETKLQCFLCVVGCCVLACSTEVGYEPEGRQFESVRARHDFNNLGPATLWQARSTVRELCGFARERDNVKHYSGEESRSSYAVEC